MKKIFTLIFLLGLFYSPCFGGMLTGSGVKSGEVNTELGFTTIGTGGSSVGRRIEITVPAGGITVSYGYVYIGNSGGLNHDAKMSIFNSSETQVGDCSAATTIAFGSDKAWIEFTWSSPVFLSAGTHYIQWVSVDYTSLSYSYTATGTGSGSNSGSQDCSTFYSNTSSLKCAMTVANYGAR